MFQFPANSSYDAEVLTSAGNTNPPSSSASAENSAIDPLNVSHISRGSTHSAIIAFILSVLRLLSAEIASSNCWATFSGRDTASGAAIALSTSCRILSWNMIEASVLKYLVVVNKSEEHIAFFSARPQDKKVLIDIFRR